MKDSIAKILELSLGQLHDAVWIWYSADGSDRLFDRFISSKYSSPSYVIVTAGRIEILVSSLDADIDFGFKKTVYGGSEELNQLIAMRLAGAGWPRRIFLNFSKAGDHKVDSLGYGTVLKLRKQLGQIYAAARAERPSYSSAEELFYALAERRSPLQVERMKLAAERAQNIILRGFSKVRVGMSERDIFEVIQSEMSSTQAKFLHQFDIAEEVFSWEQSSCPIVLVGPNLAKGGHATTSDYRIAEGETVYADFGVKLVFPDGEAVSSDLQRMAYLPTNDQAVVPPEVQAVFDTLVGAIGTGIAKIRPGMFGFEVDDLVRRIVTDAGYPTYDHSTGHPIGEVAHNPGALLGPRSNPRSRRRVQLNGTYTIEPRCQVPNGGSIEEMVLVTEAGGQPLCVPQTSLFVIGVSTTS